LVARRPASPQRVIDEMALVAAPAASASSAADLAVEIEVLADVHGRLTARHGSRLPSSMHSHARPGQTCACSIACLSAATSSSSALLRIAVSAASGLWLACSGRPDGAAAACRHRPRLPRHPRPDAGGHRCRVPGPAQSSPRGGRSA
jgi:hypothetical protein